MSRETIATLNTQTLIGYTDKRGNAWHYRAEEQGDEPNHYPGAIPVEDVRRRLFDWKPVEGQITATALTPDGVITVNDETRKAIIRPDTGTVLGVFRNSYVMHDYDEWLVTNVERILDADLAVGSAGLLKGGAVAWVQVEMAETVAAQGFEFRPFLTAATSLDGSLASTYVHGVQAVVCDNTLSAAVYSQNAERYRVKHTAHSIGRLQDARDALGILHGVEEAFTAEVEALTAQVVTDDTFRAWAKAYTDPGKAATERQQRAADRFTAELWAMWTADERVAPWRGNALGVLQAANTHLHHASTIRRVSRAERNAERVIRGGLEQHDNRVLSLLAKVN